MGKGSHLFAGIFNSVIGLFFTFIGLSEPDRLGYLIVIGVIFIIVFGLPFLIYYFNLYKKLPKKLREKASDLGATFLATLVVVFIVGAIISIVFFAVSPHKPTAEDVTHGLASYDDLSNKEKDRLDDKVKEREAQRYFNGEGSEV